MNLIEDALRELGKWLDANKGQLPRDKLEDTLLWIKVHAQKQLSASDQEVLRGKVCVAFSITEEELFESLMPVVKVDRGVDDFEELVPHHGWIRDYVEYTRFCEAPTAYHFFNAVTVIGAILKRNVWKSQGLWEIFPNMATLLVGPSTVTRKTTSADIAIHMALSTGQMRLVGENFTAEALVQELSEGDDAIGIAYVPELAATLTKQKYNDPLIPMLTRLWDCPKILPCNRITRSNITLYNVALSLLACSNEAWLVESIPDSAFKGGFMARIIQVYQATTNRRFSLPPAPPAGMGDNLRDRLEQAGFVRGEIHLTSAAEKWYDVRYNEILDTIPEDERLAPFYGRCTDHILRVAIIIRLAENDFRDRPEEKKVFIEISHLKASNDVMSWVLKYLPMVYEPLGLSPAGEDIARIKRFLRKKGGEATQPQIARFMQGRITPHQLRERMQALLDGKEVEAVDSGLWRGFKLVPRNKL